MGSYDWELPMKRLVLMISVFVFLFGMKSMLFANDASQKIARAQKQLIELKKELQEVKTSDSCSKELAIRRLEKEIGDLERYVATLRNEQKAQNVKSIQARIESLTKQLEQVKKSNSCSKNVAEMRLQKEIEDLQLQLKRIEKK